MPTSLKEPVPPTKTLRPLWRMPASGSLLPPNAALRLLLLMRAHTGRTSTQKEKSECLITLLHSPVPLPRKSEPKSIMKILVLVGAMTLQALPAMLGQTMDVVTSIKLLQMDSDSVQGFVADKLLPQTPPEHAGKWSVNYLHSSNGAETKLIVSFHEGKVSMVSWWFSGTTFTVEKLAELQNEIAFKLYPQGFERTQPAAGAGGVTLYGEMMTTPGPNEVYIVTACAHPKSRTKVEFMMELPLAGYVGEPRPTLWISIIANALLETAISKD